MPRPWLFALLALTTGCALIAGISDAPPPSGGGELADAAGDAEAAGETNAPPAAPIDLGTGKDGVLAPSGEEVVNTYYPLLSDGLPGQTKLVVGDGRGAAVDGKPREIGPGDLLLVWQSVAGEALPAGDASLPLAPWSVGRWELVRATLKNGATIDIDRPLAQSYAFAGAQVVRVPEYTEVRVDDGRSVRPESWDGRSGGVVAFFATGAVTLTGAVHADGRGLRDGQGKDANEKRACTGDGPNPDFALKGEGLRRDTYGDSANAGRARVNIGGGGGVCLNSGGAGGGHRGGGGNGGKSYGGASGDPTDGNRDVGGIGGAAVEYAAVDRLVMGGGGGAGHANNNQTPSGGRGGGVVLIRAASIGGAGELRAQGGAGRSGGNDGAGGGGAGGAVILQLRGALACKKLAVTGGNGGDTTEDVGPGGGGGGGHVHVQSTSITCPIDVAGGAAGKSTGAGGADRGAVPGSPGASTSAAAF